VLSSFESLWKKQQKNIMANELEQKIAQYQNRIGQMEAEELRDFFAELSPFIQAHTKDDKAQQAEADFQKGRDNSLTIKSLLAVFNRLVALSQTATQEKADLLIELLEPFTISYNPNSPRGKKQWYGASNFAEYNLATYGKNVFGETVQAYIDQDEQFGGRGNEVRTVLKKLREIKAGTVQAEENTANQNNNNQTNETNNNSDQTNNNDAQLAAENKVKTIIKSATTALTSSNLGV
ncbi:10970_t:CDS:1, partial [Racocetra persica]